MSEARECERSMPEGTEDDLTTILTVKGATKQEKAECLEEYQSHSNTSFLHMTQKTSHCIYSTLPFRFHILDVLSKQYPE